MSDGLLTEEEVKSFLKVDKLEVDKLIKKGKITAYRVGGAFVRFRKEEVIAVRNGLKFRMPDELERSWWDHIRDFIRFYGLYLILAGVIALLVSYFLQP
jgi:excisionase family DNA binding protein